MIRKYRILMVILGALLGTVALVRETGAEELRRRGMIGVQLAPISDDVKTRLKLETTRGVLITSAVPNSAAAEAGIQGDDILLKIGPDAIEDLPALFTVMRKYYGGDKLQFTLLREGTEKTLELTLRPRPQETPGDYELLYDSAGESGQRARVLVTRPKTEGKRPAVLIVPPINNQTVEFTGLHPHPIKSLMQEFNKAGYVTMRVERLGVGDSEGLDFQTTTPTMDIATFRAALAKLRSYDFVDGDKIFMFGHSMGAMVLPVAAKDQKLAGIMTFGAAYRPWPDSAVEAMQRRWKLELLPADQFQSRTDALKGFLDQFVSKKKSVEDILAQSPDLPEKIGQGIVSRGSVFGMPPKYATELLEKPTVAAWDALNVPVLVLWGEADFVSDKIDSEKLAQAINRGKPGKATFMPLPEVDHLLCKAADQEESFLSGQGTFHPKVMETILKWMSEATSGKGT
jgi:hypothetical protein